MAAKGERKEKSSTEVVFEAVEQLYNYEHPVSRIQVQKFTGLKQSVVDDRLATLANDGRLDRELPGYYRPVVQHPPARSVAKFLLPDGTVKLLVGEDVLTLTPRESHLVAQQMAGEIAMAMGIASGHKATITENNMERRLKASEQYNKRLEKNMELIITKLAEGKMPDIQDIECQMLQQSLPL